MDGFFTPANVRPQRSLSYNDLKRRRLQRSASHKKMVVQQKETISNRKGRNLTQQKHVIKVFQKEQGTSIQMKGNLSELGHRKSQRRFISLRESMTVRERYEKEPASLVQKKLQPTWSNMDESGQTKQLIKHLLNKNKSQRRLMKFNQIRDKLKVQKQKSRSHSKSTIGNDINQPFKQKTIEKEIRKVERLEQHNHKQTMKVVKKLQKPYSLDQSLQELNNCPQDLKIKIWEQQIQGKENEIIRSNFLEIDEISQIANLKNTDKFNQSDNIAFKKTHEEGSFLRLLANSKELKGRLLNREVRRRSQMERLRRIFPSGFFAN